ncbi:extracellular solute-binding protein family 1 [Geopyxis carbonaria]|nr:extracellular solute-binding protein family 1 [Geopyxis carbonaria]
MFTKALSLAITLLSVTALAVDPSAIYDGGIASSTSPISLRIANGGAGQSGLVKALADAYIADAVANGSKPFRVAWIKSDTTYSIKYLATGDADVGITYSPAAEDIAIASNIASSPSYYAFRDHFLIVGPESNPANLSTSTGDDNDVLTMFTQLHQAAENTNATVPTRWLSRFDKSATNIKESQLWLGIGQVPWATAYSTWYHQYIAFPLQALAAAIALEEYTLTDRGTYLSLAPELQKKVVIYKAASDEESDPLLNPAHLLIGKDAKNREVGQMFADWLVGARGQKVVTGFKKNGKQLYTGAPAKTNQAKQRRPQGYLNRM